jgi:hypothetical protein
MHMKYLVKLHVQLRRAYADSCLWDGEERDFGINILEIHGWLKSWSSGFGA